ncbi:monocarboxylate transporter 13-like [Amphiura filiformis]|uniref:monocarboxylate transporter 13-like n=1 Tax=Amphiura filiformis TaxID=82378 RepID=UPI003B224EA4
MPTEKPPPWECYWGWVVVLARFTALFMLVGTYKCFGVLLDYYIHDLGATAAEAGGASVLFVAIIYFTGPFFGVLADMHGPNGARIWIMVGGVLASIALCLSSISTNWYQLAFFLGLAGVGYGMVQVPTVAPLLMYFTDKFGLANGLSAAGAAVGMTVLPPLTEYLIQQYSWRGATIILGVINLHTTVAGALMRPPTSCKDKKTYSLLFGTDDGEDASVYELNRYLQPLKRFLLMMKERLSLGVFLHNPRFMLYQFIFLLAGLQFAGWHVFLVPNALSQGIHPIDAAFLASIGGVGNFIGRGFNGPLLDHHIFSDSMLFVLDHIICAIALLFDPLAKEYATMAILAFWAGLTIGCSYALCVVIAKNLAEEEKYVMAAVGWTHFSMGFGALVGGPLVGMTYDKTGNYHYGFLMMGGFELLLTTLTFIELMHRRHKHPELKDKYLIM